MSARTAPGTSPPRSAGLGGQGGRVLTHGVHRRSRGACVFAKMSERQPRVEVAPRRRWSMRERWMATSSREGRAVCN